MSASAAVHPIAEIEETVNAQARVTRQTRLDAEAFLAEKGLTLNDAFKMTVEAASMRMGVPSYWLGPNKETKEALEELERGGGKKFNGLEDLMADLNADD